MHKLCTNLWWSLFIIRRIVVKVRRDQLWSQINCKVLSFGPWLFFKNIIVWCFKLAIGSRYKKKIHGERFLLVPNRPTPTSFGSFWLLEVEVASLLVGSTSVLFSDSVFILLRSSRLRLRLLLRLLPAVLLWSVQWKATIAFMDWTRVGSAKQSSRTAIVKIKLVKERVGNFMVVFLVRCWDTRFIVKLCLLVLDCCW